MKKWLKRALTMLACLVVGASMSAGFAACNKDGDSTASEQQSEQQSEQSSEQSSEESGSQGGEEGNGHVHAYEETIVPATCTATGTKTLTCACGDVQTETIEKLSHVWVSEAKEEYVVTAATCIAPATYAKSCESCGEKGTETFTSGALGEHTWAESQEDAYFVAPANCERGAIYEKYCSTCTTARGEQYFVGEALGHDYEKTTIEPTCFVDGFDSYTCQRCNDTYADLSSVVKAPGEHTHTPVVTPATCTTQGYTTYTCTCGDSYVADFTAVEHTYVVTTVPSTCMAMGYDLHACECGESYKDNYQPVAAHNTPVETIVKAASCTEEGLKTITYTCECQAEYNEPIEKLAHVYVAGTPVAPTCLEKGYTVYACGCGDSYIKDYTDATGHNYVAGAPVAPTCVDKGYTEYTCACNDSYRVETAALGHVAGEWKLLKDGNGEEVLTHIEGCEYERTYQTKCETCLCDMEKKENLTKHNYIASIARVATCQYDGTKEFTCVCGASYNETYSLAEGEDGHQWSTASVKSGVETVWCQVEHCGQSKTTIVAEGADAKVSKEALAQTGEVQMEAALIQMDEATKNQLTGGEGELDLHASTLKEDDKNDLMGKLNDSQKEKLADKPVYNFTVNNGATTEFDGEMTITVPYTLAAGEDAEGIVVWYIDDNGEIAEMLATYTEINGVGYAVFKTNHFSKYTVVRLTPSERCAIYGHNEKTREVLPTCETDGYLLTYCIRCGYNETADVYKATGHSYLEVKTEATCTAQGYTDYVCEHCNKFYRDNYVEALGHNYNEKEYEATCTTAGYVEYICERCNHNYQTTTEEALGHDWNIKDNKPTCKENGSTVYHCKHCNYNYKVVHSPKADHEYKETEKKATCYSKGYTEYMCEFCQAIYKDKFTDMAEHHYVTTVVDPTCTAKGYTLHACDNEGCTDSYKDNYKSETGHKYGADFLCEVCGAEHPAVNHGAKGFYVTLRESLMMADNYLVTVDNFTYTSTTDFEGILTDKENYTMNILELTFGFDEDGYIVGHGRFEMPVEMFDYNKEGEVTDSTSETYLMQIIFKNGKAYVFTGEMAGDVSTYECYVLLSQEYMFDEVGFPVTALRTYYLDLYSDNARKVIATAMGITDKEINNAIGALVEYMFVKSETGDGYTFTFNAQQAYVVIEKLATRSVKELVETIFGAGQYDKIFEKVNEALNGTIGDFESKIEKRLTAAGYKLDDLYSLLNTGIGMIFAEASHIDEFDLREFVNEYRDEVVAELLADEMGISVENLKSMVQDVQDMCETRSLISVIFEMSGEAEDEAEAEEYIDYMLDTVKEYLPYFGETNITLTTDRNGKASALSVKLDVQVESKMMNEKDGVYTTTIVVKGNGTIKLNDSFELTFGDLIDKVEDYIGDVKLEVGSVIKGYEGGMDYVVYGKDGAIIVTQNIENFNSIQKYGEKVLLGTEVINGIEYNKYSVYLYGGYASEMLPGGIYQEKYVEFEAYYYDAESGGIVVDDYCGDWTNYGLLSRRGAVYYTVWALEDGTVANFELDWDATVGALHYTDTFYFWYNAKTGEMKRENVHNYEIVDSYETDVCGESCWYIYECTACGDSYKSKRTVDHNIERYEELVEGATSCTDGWYRVYKCTKCDYVEKERYKESHHNETHNIVVVETPCGEARIEYYSCACGYEHNTNLYFYEEDGCQFESFYEETQFDEEGYPIPQDMMYKCQTCGTVITIKSSGNNYGEKYSAYGLSYKEPIYDYNDPNYNSGSNVVIGKPDYEYSEYPDYEYSEYPGYDKPGYEEGDKPGYDVSCYVEGFFQIYVNDVLVVDKQYKVAQHGDTEWRERWEGEYRIEESVCYYCGTTLTYTKYDQNYNVVYTVNEKGMGYRVEQEGCKRITYYFNAQGDYDSMTEERHGNYYYVMELRKAGTTCMDGLKIYTYCGGCDELQYTESYRPEGHPVEQAMPQYMEIATACGTVTLEYVVCPCGAQGTIYDLDPGACEMKMTGDDTTQAMTCTKCGFKAELTRKVWQEGCVMKGEAISTVSYGGNVFFSGVYTMEQEYHNTEYVTTTDENGNRVEAYMCTGCGMVEESTTYDQYDRVIRRVYSDGSGREYIYDGCKVSERYFDSNGETYGGAGYENHTWGYTFEFLTASKNCEAGVRWINKCTVCGEEQGSHVDYGHNTIRDKNAFYTVQAGCGTMYVRGENCPCNYAGIMWHGIWVETSCGVDTQEEWLEDTETEIERRITTYTCWNCGYTYTEYRYTSIASCKVTYHLVYSFGENGCDGTFEISYTEERHEQIRREEGATDDGKYLWEYYCEACGTWIEHHEYKRDQYGRTVWFMDRLAGTGWEIVYGDNCKYTRYTLNQAGERIDSEEGTEHGEFVHYYELAPGSVTCEDGVICAYQCSACGYVENQWTSYSHETFLHTLEINTECGRTYFDYYECACGMVVRTDMRVYGACDTTWFSGTSLDSYYEHNIHEYVCYITECGFSYSVESYYYYENANSCLATHVLIYKLYNNGELIISKTGTDQGYIHQMVYERTDYEDGSWMEVSYCKFCGNKTINKYDKYGRWIYHWDDESGYGWKREFTLCDYVQYRFYRDGRRYEDGWGTDHVWVHDRYIQEACTQYGTRISYCKCCGEDDLYEYVWPSHGYEWNDEKQTYVCWRCGLENDKGVDGDFVVEDLTWQYGGYTAGFFNRLGDRWEMEDGYNFYIVLNYDENAIGVAGKNVVVDVSYDLLEYGYEETGAAGSGIITLDMDELNAAITKAYGENWNGFENVSIVFQVFDKDFETGQFSYVDYVLTFSRI